MILVTVIPAKAGMYAAKITKGANSGCLPLYISGKKGIHKPHDIANVRTKKATTWWRLINSVNLFMVFHISAKVQFCLDPPNGPGDH
jgi:hypothetical protein